MPVKSLLPDTGWRFTNLPDHGELFSKAAAGSQRVEGAYTWRPTEISETHAIAAIGAGKFITLTAENGRHLSFQYQRHIEHADGSWTWIGALPGQPGQETILTFGAKAVFGSIAQGLGELPLQLTLRDGHPWLVSTDRLKLTAAGQWYSNPAVADAVLPPIRTGVSSRQANKRAITAPASNAAAAVVDVLVGYTTGFASDLGGDSQASTRINFLIDVGNQAHSNGQTGVQLRLVKAMAVSYADATSNNDTLDRLTGVDTAQKKLTTPDPAFNALRRARDEYGADLVALVRKFNAPENGSCGVAWLVGGSESVIVPTEDEFYGYSVISDGSDTSEVDSKTYFCRQEALVHELGHNMGSAHDVSNSTNTGAYPYSYGYKTAISAGNFYTVMSYGDAGQTAYRTFSNPDTSFCGGQACGVANTSDNARSLRQAASQISQFRASKITSGYVRNDIDGDGRSDLVLTNTSLFAYWLMDRNIVRKGVLVGGAGGTYKIAYTGDFNGDGRADMVYRNPQGNMWLWTLAADNVTVTAREIGTPPPGWEVFASADVNGDGRSDLLLRNGVTVSCWEMNGSTVLAGRILGSGESYIPLSAGDFNGDGHAEVLLRDPSTRRMKLWFVNVDWSIDGQTSGRLGEGWTLFSVDDADGDGKDDLFLRSGTLLAYWLMDGVVVRSGVVVGGAGGSYVAVRTGDFDGDGKADVIYQDSSKNMWLWNLQQPGAVQVAEIGTPEGAWSVLDWPAVYLPAS